MARRTSSNEPLLGSDSFLDVLANMVGILIILIVVAGMRVSQSAARTAKAMRAAATQAPPAAPGAAAAPIPIPRPAPVPTPAEPPAVSTLPPVAAEPEWSVELGTAGEWPADALEVPLPVAAAPAPTPIEPAPPAEPPPELVAQSRVLEGGLARLRDMGSQLDVQLKALRNIAPDPQRGAEMDQLLTQEEANIEADGRRIVELRLAIEAAELQVNTAQATLAKEQTLAPPTQMLKHHLNAVARTVTGKELHFRVEKDRVSVVPVDDLAGEMQRQIKRQRDQILSRERFLGHAGPVGGFEMEYVLEREGLSRGTSIGEVLIRMEVTGWVIHPASNMSSETAAEALTPGSRFLRAIQSTPGAALTFWVYPDGFAAYRELQEAAQASGLRVAARPLPVGVPIAGSNKGAKSLAQ